MVLIVCAMDSEANEIKKSISNLEIGNITKEKYYYKGQINNIDVILVIAGVGKVNAAVMTTFLLNKYKNIKTVLNVGLAGAYFPYKIGDVVTIKDSSYHDVNVKPINPIYEIGQVPNMPHPFLSDDKLFHKMSFELKSKIDSLYTGDQFITSDLLKSKGVYDMEGAAIYHTAHIFDKPVIAIKVISDIIDSKDQKKVYEAFEANAATQIKEIVFKIIN